MTPGCRESPVLPEVLQSSSCLACSCEQRPQTAIRLRQFRAEWLQTFLHRGWRASDGFTRTTFYPHTERKNDTPDGVVIYLSKTPPRTGSRGVSLRRFFWGVLSYPRGVSIQKEESRMTFLGSQHRTNDPPLVPADTPTRSGEHPFEGPRHPRRGVAPQGESPMTVGGVTTGLMTPRYSLPTPLRGTATPF